MNPSPEHEALCRRCGRCCYVKMIIAGRVITTTRPCPYLDVETKLCTVYERRFEVNPRCLDVESGVKWGVFPADCPYVADLPDYVPAEDGWLDEETVRKIEAGMLRTSEEVAAEVRGKRSEV